jgi:hypothetical protein
VAEEERKKGRVDTVEKERKEWRWRKRKKERVEAAEEEMREGGSRGRKKG